MAALNDAYETDAVRLFVRDRSTQRIADANAERLASQIRTAPGHVRQRVPAYPSHSWQRVHIRIPHLTH